MSCALAAEEEEAAVSLAPSLLVFVNGCLTTCDAEDDEDAAPPPVNRKLDELADDDAA